MKKIVLLPAILMICLAVTVGAFNVVSGNDNRPYTLQEAMQELSSFSYSMDDVTAILERINELWGTDTLASAGGGANGGGTLVSARFGTSGYIADTGVDWLDTLLQTLSDALCTVLSLGEIVYIFIRDTFTLFVTVFSIAKNLLIGVPIT